jgi:hypothetical protein
MRRIKKKIVLPLLAEGASLTKGAQGRLARG